MHLFLSLSSKFCTNSLILLQKLPKSFKIKSINYAIFNNNNDNKISNIIYYTMFGK